MAFLPKLTYQITDPKRLAHSTLQRFEQIVIFLPLPEGDDVPDVGARLRLDMALPDSPMLAENLVVQVCCVLSSRNTLDNHWIGILIHDDNDHDIETRIRRLTHDYSAEYGKLIGSMFR